MLTDVSPQLISLLLKLKWIKLYFYLICNHVRFVYVSTSSCSDSSANIIGLCFRGGAALWQFGIFLALKFALPVCVVYFGDQCRVHGFQVGGSTNEATQRELLVFGWKLCLRKRMTRIDGSEPCLPWTCFCFNLKLGPSHCVFSFHQS